MTALITKEANLTRKETNGIIRACTCTLISFILLFIARIIIMNRYQANNHLHQYFPTVSAWMKHIANYGMILNVVNITSLILIKLGFICKEKNGYGLIRRICVCICIALSLGIGLSIVFTLYEYNTIISQTFGVFLLVDKLLIFLCIISVVLKGCSFVVLWYVFLQS